MQSGTKVKTNQRYFEKYGRVVYGVVASNAYLFHPIATIIKVTHQTGKIIPDHHEELVVMMKNDLEVVSEDISHEKGYELNS